MVCASSSYLRPLACPVGFAWGTRNNLTLTSKVCGLASRWCVCARVWFWVSGVRVRVRVRVRCFSLRFRCFGCFVFCVLWFLVFFFFFFLGVVVCVWGGGIWIWDRSIFVLLCVVWSECVPEIPVAPFPQTQTLLSSHHQVSRLSMSDHKKMFPGSQSSL